MLQHRRINMKVDLQQLSPANISDEAAFQLVIFIRNLALALESNYFDNMLCYTSQNQRDSDAQNEQGAPF